MDGVLLRMGDALSQAEPVNDGRDWGWFVNLQVGLKPGLEVGTAAVACFVPGTGVSKAQSFGWCALLEAGNAQKV